MQGTTQGTTNLVSARSWPILVDENAEAGRPSKWLTDRVATETLTQRRRGRRTHFDQVARPRSGEIKGQPARGLHQAGGLD